MDDLKLFAKSDEHLETLFQPVHMFSSDVCFTFGLDKYAKASVCRGKIVRSNDIPLSYDCSIHALGANDTYKYLGFHEAEGLDCAKTNDLHINVYNTHLKLVYGSLLRVPRKTRAMNSFCVPILSYGFGIVPWTKK